MPIFQKSVIQKHLAHLEQNQLDNAFNRFKNNYSIDKIQLIKTLKEEEYQDGFLRDIFVDVFGYTLKPDNHFNLVREFKNQTDGKKADGAILKEGNAIAVIELKSTQTKDLKSITQQAFNYKNNQPHCQYVITSNFQKLRFYIDYANEYEEFDLFHLDKATFALLYLILNKDNLLNGLPKQIKEETKSHEDNISEQFYKDYSQFKQEIFANLTQNNPQFDQLLLFKKSQKFLDRLLFILFAEDTGLLPPNSIATEIENWETLQKLNAYDALSNRLNLFFQHLNKGYHSSNYDIPAYNGGLFASDKILDKLNIDDRILKDNLLKLAAYNFNTKLDVNILGQIFEHSLNDLEEITAKIEGKATTKENTKRKKDGIFYTPKYITQYIVENTLGTLCAEKRQQLNLVDIEFDESYWRKDTSLSAKGKELFKTLEAYKNWLLTLKILDPACGSGAFLNQALNFLIAEHQEIDNIIADLTHAMPKFYDTDKMILENNIYGVDINEESVEIAQLSLWLRTAKKGRKLSNLSRNIKCGNSLIDDPAIAGDKAFDWNKAFPKIMQKGGFDIVIGNPPYVSIQGIDWDLRRYFECTYQSANRRFDLYSLFIEKAIFLNKIKGLLSFIVPGKFLNNLQFATTREMLCKKGSVKVANIDDKVFSEAHVNSVIIINYHSLGSNTQYQYKSVNLDIRSETELSQINIEHLLQDKNKTFRLETNTKLDNLILKMRKDTKPVSEIGEVKDGIVAGGIKDVLFLIKQKDEHCKKLYFGKHLSRYSIMDTHVWVNYKPQEMMQIEVERKGHKRPGLWMRDEKIFIRDKILTRFVGKEIIAYYDNTKRYYEHTLHSTYIKNEKCHVKYVLSLFNSKLFTFYYQKTNSKGGNIFPQIRISSIEKLPIKEISKKAQQPFIEKANLMLGLNKALQEKKAKFINRITSNLEIAKISKKLDAFYNLDFKTLVAEFKKQKVTLTLVQQDEWEEYFAAYKTEIKQLQNQIDATDKKIDHQVYALYGLTKEEIGLVEGNE